MNNYLLDTNILLRLIEKTSPQHPMVLQALTQIATKNDSSFIVMQSITELWAVATRPIAANGLGYTTARVRTEVDGLLQRFDLLPENELIFEVWLELVTVNNVQGKPTHDARLVAAMMTHGIENILTINTADFKRFTQVNAVHPLEVTQ
jgi:predicted nucleic acid-binding protein